MDGGGRPHGAHRDGPQPAAHGAGRAAQGAQRDRGATRRSPETPLRHVAVATEDPVLIVDE